MKLQNLVACVSEVLSTWQYHELSYIITIVFCFFFPPKSRGKGLTSQLIKQETGKFHHNDFAVSLELDFLFYQSCVPDQITTFFFFLEEKCLQLITNSIAHSRLNLDNLGQIFSQNTKSINLNRTLIVSFQSKDSKVPNYRSVNVANETLWFKL